MKLFGDNVLVEMLRDQNQRLTSETAWLRGQVESLTAKVAEVKREGYTWAAEPTLARQESQDVPDVVQMALDKRMEPGSPEYAETLQWALRLLAAGMDQENVADQILKGGDFD